MTEAIRTFLKDKITGVDPETASHGLAVVIGRLPEWAQATLLSDNMRFKDIKKGILERERAMFYPAVKGKSARVEAEFSAMNPDAVAHRLNALGNAYHEIAHGVDHQDEIIGASFGNQKYRDFATSLLKTSPNGLSHAEQKIWKHANQPRYKRFDVPDLPVEIRESIKPVHEVQAETGRHYFSAYAKHLGDEAKIEAEMSQELPKLWPAFRDNLIPQYIEKTKDQAAKLRQEKVIVGDKPVPYVPIVSNADKVVGWVEKVGSRKLAIGAGGQCLQRPVLAGLSYIIRNILKLRTKVTSC